MTGHTINADSNVSVKPGSHLNISMSIRLKQKAKQRHELKHPT